MILKIGALLVSYTTVFSLEIVNFLSLCDGNFMSKEPDDPLKFLDQIAKKTHQWEGLNPLESVDWL